MTSELTKTDTRAIWYAVDAYASMVKAMKGLPSPVTQDVIDKERQVLATAKRALRKVNAIRKGQAVQIKRETAGGTGT